MILILTSFQTVVGNFDANLISTRCAAFESLLDLMSNDSRLRDCPAAITFFQDVELSEAKRLINEGKFDQALSILETSFKLLNKVIIFLHAFLSLKNNIFFYIVGTHMEHKQVYEK